MMWRRSSFSGADCAFKTQRGRQRHACLEKLSPSGVESGHCRSNRRFGATLTNDQHLHDEGVVDEAAGQAQDAFGHARRKVGEVIQDIGKAVKK